MAKYSYVIEAHSDCPTPDPDAWWVLCPWCGYDGPEPPVPGLEPLPGHHEVMLCPSCRGRLEQDHGEVQRRRVQRKIEGERESQSDD